jgi:hypothetical protein
VELCVVVVDVFSAEQFVTFVTRQKNRPFDRIDGAFFEGDSEERSERFVLELDEGKGCQRYCRMMWRERISKRKDITDCLTTSEIDRNIGDIPQRLKMTEPLPIKM